MQIRHFVVFGLSAVLAVLLLALAIGLFRYLKSKTKDRNG